MTIALPAMAAKGGNGATGGGKGHGGGGSGGSGGTSCTQNAPRASITNTWSWQARGSWGMPGQQLKYAILVFNDDSGCGSSTFAISVSAPDGFSVSIPADTITLASGSTGYVWAYVTSPATAADGDYLLTATDVRVGAGAASTTGSSTSYYKVYSSDTVAPSLFMPRPTDGAAISGRSYSVGVSSSDDHAVKQIDLYLDNVHTSTTLCGDISSNCMLSYSWDIGGVHGQHTATFKSTDWMDNSDILTVTFSVN